MGNKRPKKQEVCLSVEEKQLLEEMAHKAGIKNVSAFARARLFREDNLIFLKDGKIIGEELCKISRLLEQSIVTDSGYSFKIQAAKEQLEKVVELLIALTQKLTDLSSDEEDDE